MAASNQAGQMIGGEEGKRLEQNMGDMITFTGAIENKDAAVALNTAATSFIDPAAVKSMKGVVEEKAFENNIDITPAEKMIQVAAGNRGDVQELLNEAIEEAANEKAAIITAAVVEEASQKVAMIEQAAT